MKTLVPLAFLLSILLGSTLSSVAVDRPAITSITLDASRITVTVHVPAGIQRVTLESRTRLGAGSWIPVRIERTDGTETTLTFNLTMSAQLEVLRVRGDTAEELPASFFSGQKQFAGPVGDAFELGSPPNSPVPGEAPTDGAPGGDAGGDRTVAESDIWAFRDDTLYFFNQYRGLQMLNIADPANPALLGTFPVTAAGEQMYVLDPDHVALLTDRHCPGTVFHGTLVSPDRVVTASASTSPAYNGTTSEVLLIRTTNGELEHLASLAVPGRILESRLVGTALYVASRTYREVSVTDPNDPVEPPDDGSRSWEHGTLLSSFDLSDIANPLARGSLWFPGSGHDIYATNERLFISTQDSTDYWKSIVHMIDIASPDGTLQELASIPAGGRVQDKFKMNLNGDIFTVISQVRGSRGIWTALETFDVANAANPTRLAGIQLAEGETVFGTRFDGNKAYIVTFLRIDPLWIVDLSDPSNPTILGELEVPGWSTYVHPLGDQLVTVGIDDTEGWRVAVSLFDVSDPANPSLLDKEVLGDSWSESEANQDEKAFKVLPEDNLILVPFSGNTQNGYASQIQLIDLEPNSLALRGKITHQMRPRRATLHRDSILSISAKELISVNASDRDQPEVQATLTLSWGVDRVISHGDYLIEVDEGELWRPQATSPALRVVAKADPARVLETITLPKALPISGLEQDGDHLFVLQSRTAHHFYPGAEEDPHAGDEPAEPEENVFLSVYHLDLPTLTGGLAASLQVEDFAAGSLQVNALRPRGDTLVWHHAGSNFSWWGPWFGGIEPAPGMPMVDSVMPWPYYQPSKPTFIAFDTSSPTQPAHLSTFQLDLDSGYSFSSAFTAGGKIFFSYQKFDHLVSEVADDGNDGTGGSDSGATDSNQNSNRSGAPTTNTTTSDPDSSGSVPATEPAPDDQNSTETVIVWMQKYYLSVIDYADPANPTARLPVDLPGTLKGLSHDGAILYTEGSHWDDEFKTDNHIWLDALAYDGLEASLVASLQLPQVWPRPLILDGAAIYLGNASTDAAGHTIQAWKLTTEGNFALRAESALEKPAQSFHLIEDLLAVMTQDSVKTFHRHLDPPLQEAGDAGRTSCIWYNINHAAGSLAEGLWIPLNDYGLHHLRLDQ